MNIIKPAEPTMQVRQTTVVNIRSGSGKLTCLFQTTYTTTALAIISKDKIENGNARS